MLLRKKFNAKNMKKRYFQENSQKKTTTSQKFTVNEFTSDNSNFPEYIHISNDHTSIQFTNILYIYIRIL